MDLSNLTIPEKQGTFENKGNTSNNKQKQMFDEREVQKNIKSQDKEGESPVLKLKNITVDYMQGESGKHFEHAQTYQLSIQEESPPPPDNPAPHLVKVSEVLSSTSLPTNSEKESLLDEKLLQVKQELNQAEKSNTLKEEQILKLKAENTRLKEDAIKRKANKPRLSLTSKISEKASSYRERRIAIEKKTGIASKTLSPTADKKTSEKQTSSKHEVDETPKVDTNVGQETFLAFGKASTDSRVPAKSERPKRTGWQYSEIMEL